MKLLPIAPGSINITLIPKGSSSYAIDSLKPSIANLTTIMVGIHNSVHVLDSSDDFKIREISKGGNLQGKKSESPGHKLSCIAFDPQTSDRAYWGIFDTQMIVAQSWNNIGKDSFSIFVMR